MATLKNAEEPNKDEKLNIEELQSAAGGMIIGDELRCEMCGRKACARRVIEGRWRNLCYNPDCENYIKKYE